MSNHKLVQKTLKLTAIGAIAFSTLAQPLSHIVNAAEAPVVANKAENRLLSTDSQVKELLENPNLIPIPPNYAYASQIFPKWQQALVKDESFIAVSAIGADTQLSLVGRNVKNVDGYEFTFGGSYAEGRIYNGVNGTEGNRYSDNAQVTILSDTRFGARKQNTVAFYQDTTTTVGVTYELKQIREWRAAGYHVLISDATTGRQLAYTSLSSVYEDYVLSVGNSGETLKTSPTSFVATSNKTRITILTGGPSSPSTSNMLQVLDTGDTRNESTIRFSLKVKVNADELKSDINKLFVNDTPTSNAIKITTDQAKIDELQAKINELLPGTPKTELQNELDLAQELLDARTSNIPAQNEAREAVNALFLDNNPANNIKDTTNQAAINAAQEKVNAVTDATVKAALQADIDKAQRLLDDKNKEVAAQTSVADLFIDNNVSKHIKALTDQAAIDAAKTKVNAVTDATKKATLLEQIDKAQREFDAFANAIADPVYDTDKAFWGKQGPSSGEIVFKIYDPTGTWVKAQKVVSTTEGGVFSANLDGWATASSQGAPLTGSSTIQLVAGEKLQAGRSPLVTIQSRYQLASDATKQLFINDDATKHIKGLTDQAKIDAAKALVNAISDATQKAALLVNIDKAQNEFNALINAVVSPINVGDTFIAGSKGPETGEIVFKIYDATGTWVKAQKVVTTSELGTYAANLNGWATAASAGAPLTGSSTIQLVGGEKVQAGRSALVTIQSTYQTASDATKQLFIDNDPTKDIKNTTTQAAIDAAQALVNQVENATQKAALQADIDKAQRQLDQKGAQTAAQTAVDNLFVNNDPTKDIKDTTTKAVIDAAQELVNKVTDPSKKAEMQAEVDKAKRQLEQKEAAAEATAQTAINELFVNNDPSKDIKGTTTQASIDAAQALVDKVTDPAKKAEMQAEIDKAQKEFNDKSATIAKPEVNAVTNNDTTVKGKGTPGLTISVSNGTSTFTSVVAPNGTFSVTIPLQKADTILTVTQKNTVKSSASVSIKVSNYIPAEKVTINPVGPFQQAVTGKAPVGTKMVRLLVNGVAQRTVAPEADGSFSIYSRFVTDGLVSNLRLKAGDTITVDYGNKTPANLATTIKVSAELVKPIVNDVVANADYITGMVPVGTQTLRLVVNGRAQRTVTPQANIDAVTAGGIGTDGKFKIYSRFITDETGVSRKLKAGDRVTIDSGVQIPGDTGTTVVVK
ncbi:toxin Cry1Ac domain D-VI-related protein [Listeria booriae]|uniref:Bacterial Ig domain-containing protein n=1 Tax=Listeria booriae TaxID=1552123 RepID=A0A842A0W2_9LIST|nr:toxin Cry1Ac domain D-VI-related protein [Listeria booriae]MBC1566576.1 hypothetical protein [Listeria booriae]